MPVTVRCETEKGGAVKLGNDVMASYAVAGTSGSPPPELVHIWIDVPGKPGQQIQLFVNRGTGLVVVERVDTRTGSGKEFFRKGVYDETLPGRLFVAESLDNELVRKAMSDDSAEEE